jgi:hypothetical protein
MGLYKCDCTGKCESVSHKKISQGEDNTTITVVDILTLNHSSSKLRATTVQGPLDSQKEHSPIQSTT